MDAFENTYVGSFQYSPLESADGHLRLLRFLPETTPDDIHCSLGHFERHGPGSPAYTALSYCWGDPNVTLMITVNSHRVNVTQNLWQALSYIWQYHDNETRKFLWIDALCINQTDLLEKNEQVHKMWLTFSQAETVYAWLGPEDEHAELALEVMYRLSRKCNAERSSCGCHIVALQLPQSESDALRALHGRKYFYRAWIMPEFLQARELKILCGRHATDFALWKHFKTTGASVLRQRDSRLEDNGGGLLKNRGLPPGFRLACLLGDYGGTNCFDLRDKVFAALADPDLREIDTSRWMKPDYNLDRVELSLLVVAWFDFIDRGFFRTMISKMTEHERKGYAEELLEWIFLFFRDSIFNPGYNVEESRNILGGGVRWKTDNVGSDVKEFRNILAGGLRWKRDNLGRDVLIMNEGKELVVEETDCLMRYLLGNLIPRRASNNEKTWTPAPKSHHRLGPTIEDRRHTSRITLKDKKKKEKKDKEQRTRTASKASREIPARPLKPSDHVDNPIRTRLRSWGKGGTRKA